MKKKKSRNRSRLKFDHNGEIITKHNAAICAKKNTEFLERECSVYADIGDLSYYDIGLRENVSNSLKKDVDRMYRMHSRY